MDDCFAYRHETREEAIDWAPAARIKPVLPGIQIAGFSGDHRPKRRDGLCERFRDFTDETWRNWGDGDYFAWLDELYAQSNSYKPPIRYRRHSLERLTTASASDVAACGVNLGAADVALRFAYRPALDEYTAEDFFREYGRPPIARDGRISEPVVPNGTIQVALLILRKPDDDIEDPRYALPLENYVVYIEDTLDDLDGWLALIGVYEDGRSEEPVKLPGLRRCFRLIDGKWMDRSYYACPAAPAAKSVPTKGAYPEFDNAFDAVAGGQVTALVAAVRRAFLSQRTGTPEAKRGAWFRALAKAKTCGYSVNDDLISRSVTRYA